MMEILRVDYKSENAKAEFAKSLRDTGFAVIRNHTIPPEMVLEVRELWANFFASSEQEKFKYKYNRDDVCQNGYFPFMEEYAKNSTIPNLMEYFHYYPWCDTPSELKVKTLEMYSMMMDLGRELLEWIELALPADIRSSLDQPLVQMIENTNSSLMRVIHYPPITNEVQEGALRSSPHEDIDLLTLLVAASAPGLQVLKKDGSWFEVTPDHGEIVCNVGDMMEMATKGYYKSTTHQVVNPVGDLAYKPRYSMPLFIHPRDEVRLNQEHTAGSYLKSRLVEQGLTNEERKIAA